MPIRTGWWRGPTKCTINRDVPRSCGHRRRDRGVEVTTGHARTHGPRTRTRPPSSWGGDGVVRGTLGWYGDASGGFFLETLDEWNPRLAFLVFPRITSSSRIDRCEIGRFELDTQPIATLPIARQVRELQAALSVNKSEVARILRVSRPTVYDWLEGGEPNAGNRVRIGRPGGVGCGSAGVGERTAVSAVCEVSGGGWGTESS